MSERAVQLVVEQLPIEKRLDLAMMDDPLCRTVLAFRDVSLAFLRNNDETVVCNEKHQLAAVTKLSCEVLAVHFGKISKLVVQCRLPTEDWRSLFKLSLLKKLFISVDNLKTIGKLEDGEKLAGLKSLYLLHRMDHPLNGHVALSKKDIEHLFCPSLTRLCLTGLSLRRDAVQLIFSLPNLTSLDLIGTIVDTCEMRDLQHTLVPPTNLEEVSLPPSWFSFSSFDSYNEPNYLQKFNFRWLAATPKLCLFVQNYSEKMFWPQLADCMPRGLDTLVLYGNCEALKRSAKFKAWNKFRILFGPPDAQLLTFSSFGRTRLISHLVRKPPFTNGQLKAVNTCNWQLQIHDPFKAAADFSEESDVETVKEMGEAVLHQRVLPVIRRQRLTHRRRIAFVRRHDNFSDLEEEAEPETARELSPLAREAIPRRRNPPAALPRRRGRRNRRPSTRSRTSSRRSSAGSDTNTTNEGMTEEVHTGREASPIQATVSSLSVQFGSSQRSLLLSSVQEPSARSLRVPPQQPVEDESIMDIRQPQPEEPDPDGEQIIAALVEMILIQVAHDLEQTVE